MRAQRRSEMKKGVKTIILTIVLILLLFVWAPWMDNQAIHDKVFQEKAHKDGTMGWITKPDGTRVYTLLCPYNVRWRPFGRIVVSCEGGYFVTFWGKII
jgi:hypothetical protein